MKYRVFHQKFVLMHTEEAVNHKGEYAPYLVHVGDVHAPTPEDALEVAKRLHPTIAPIIGY